MTAEDTRSYDVVVIGAGPVGENVADRTTAAGLSTVIVESELVGGECSYWACEPSKALLRPALLRAEVARVPGVQAGGAPWTSTPCWRTATAWPPTGTTTARSNGSGRPASTSSAATAASTGHGAWP
ncbi:FAD-dependent oxidoreductase [Nonomuraea thailandensis]